MDSKHVYNTNRRAQPLNSNNSNAAADADNTVLSAAANQMRSVHSTIDAAALHKHHRSRDNIDYNKDLELLLKDNAEECESLGILHRASYEKYNRLSNYINIPVIILSSAIGFATGIDIGYANMNIILGVGSIFVGIIKSIDTYFQLGKRSESHRLCSLQYQQIHKKIQIELALQREQRQTAKDMLSVIKTDIKNLQDISPLVDQDIIDNYNDKYGKYTTVKKPNFVNGLTEVSINDTDEHGRDVLHSRPRSAPVSAGGSLSGSDDEEGPEIGSGSGMMSRKGFTSDNMNSLIQIHAIKSNKNISDNHENMFRGASGEHSLNNTPSGLSQHSNNSSANAGYAPVVDHNHTSSLSLDTLTAPSLLNTFTNMQHLHQSNSQTPRNVDAVAVAAAAIDTNVIITLNPGNNIDGRLNNDDNDNGAM